jgi:dihydrofolate reductase
MLDRSPVSDDYIETRGNAMRKVILQEFVTIDGLAAGPNASVDFIPAWTRDDRSFEQHQLRFTETIDTILLGRVTYGMFAGYWPNATTETDKAADALNLTPKLVFSKTLDRAPWGKYAEAKVVKTGAAETVAKLKELPGKDMVLWGSISLARSLMKAGQIDQYQLVVLPVVLGRGTPLFGDDAPELDLKLQETKSFDRGQVVLTYAR